MNWRANFWIAYLFQTSKIHISFLEAKVFNWTECIWKSLCTAQQLNIQIKIKINHFKSKIWRSIQNENFIQFDTIKLNELLIQTSHPILK